MKGKRTGLNRPQNKDPDGVMLIEEHGLLNVNK
jgi:hypothetical protein